MFAKLSNLRRDVCRKVLIWSATEYNLIKKQFEYIWHQVKNLFVLHADCW